MLTVYSFSRVCRLYLKVSNAFEKFDHDSEMFASSQTCIEKLNEQVSVPVPEHDAQVPIPVIQVPVQVLGMQVQVKVPVLN